jgi:NDP-sugar pyrophosphorylase family protein
MQKYRVYIPTAGQGSRLGQITNYFNKALIKVGNKAVISHIIEQFPIDVEFVISLGYKKDNVKQYLEIAHPNNKFIFIDVENYGKGYGPGHALKKCKHELQCPFLYWSCDSLVEADFDEYCNLGFNWVGYDEIDIKKSNEFCTMELDEDELEVKKIFDKQQGTNKAYIGISFVRDYEEFWNHMDDNNKLINDEIQLSPALFKMKNLAPLKFSWFDTGNLEGLEKARKFYKGIEILQKLDEEIYVINNNVIKFFHNTSMITGRIERAKKLKGLVPDIISYSKNFYKYKFQEGNDLFRVNRVDEEFPRLLEYSKEKLWQDIELIKQDKLIFKDCCRRFYKDKTIARMEKLFNDKNFKDESIFINGLKVPNIKEVLNLINWDYICEGLPCLGHGDFVLPNVLLTEDNEFIFIDFRQEFGGLIDYFDKYYDFAKMMACLHFPLKSIREKKFYAETYKIKKIKTFIEIPMEIEKCKDYFEEWLDNEHYDIDKVKILTGLVLLNMSPLHPYPLDEWLYYYGKWYLYKSLREKYI